MRFDRIFRIWSACERLIKKLPPWLQVVLIAITVAFAMIAGLLIAVLLSVPYLLWRILAGVWFRFFPPPATRDVARLGGDEIDLDFVTETVKDEGQLLKEHQHRRIRRDRRLLPKPKPPADVWPRPRRKRVMRAAEANRLFAGTLRTRNRQIRDLLADEEQLKRYQLPVWKTEDDVAGALGLSVGELRHYSIHRDKERVCHYVSFAIPKRRGGQRTIMAPKRRLKQIQQTLLKELVEKLPVSQHAHGFRRGRSIGTGAAPHVGRAVLLKLDLRDFFPTVTFARVRGYLIALGYGYHVATTLAVLMTEAERQPVDLEGDLVYVPVGPRHCVQGAPTSPGLCNALCLRLDRRLAGLAKKYGWSYTRYADDLTFSGDAEEHAQTVLRLARQICRDEGFEVHPEKTRIARRGRRQTVTGVVVNDVPGLSRQERRQLRAVIHRLNAGEEATLAPAQVSGKLAYLQMLNPDQAAALRSKWGR